VVYQVFSDFAKFPEYVPMTQEAKPEIVGPNLVDVKFTVNVKMAFFSYSIIYSCYHYNRPAIYRSDWCLSGGEFKNNSGFYQAIPVDEGRRSMLWYSTHSEPNSSFLRSLYTREPTLELMTNVSAATMLARALKQRAEEVYRQSPGYQPLPKRGAPRPIQEVLLDDPQTLKLLAERGKILVLEDGPTVYATAGTVVNAPPEQAFDVVARFEDAPQYIPGVRKVESRGQGAKGPKFFWAVEMNLAFLTYKYEYELEYELDRPRRINWMIPRTAGDAPGFWQFVPLDQGRHCLIFNGSTADIRAMGLIPRYALKTEPTLEHALIASQGTIGISATKDYIQQQTKAPK
jgi:ribosome-associated toxin RatA of RatAB toxin-antitoxin module